MPVQTIRRKIDTETYEDLASGDRSFVICVPSEDVQPDDYFVFVEMVSDKANREVYRKVSIVVAVEDTDVIIAGLVPVEYQALSSIFAHNNVLVAYGLQKRDGEETLLEQPAFLPMLTAPPLNPHQTNNYLGVDTWPDGQYSIMLKCYMTPVEDGRQDVTITEYMIMCRTRIEGDENEEPVELFVQVDHRYLIAGKIKDNFGNEIVAYFGTEGEQDDNLIPLDEINEALLGGAEEAIE